MAGEIRLGPSRPAVVSPRRQKPSLAQSAAFSLLTTHLADPFSNSASASPVSLVFSANDAGKPWASHLLGRQWLVALSQRLVSLSHSTLATQSQLLEPRRRRSQADADAVSSLALGAPPSVAAP